MFPVLLAFKNVPFKTATNKDHKSLKTTHVN